MTLIELKQKLSELSKEDFQKFNSEFSEKQQVAEESVNIEFYLIEFSNHPELERLFCTLLGLQTEDEKRTAATISSADAARKSATSAKLSIICTLIAIAIACISLYLQYFYKNDNVQVTIMSARPNTSSTIYKSAFVADVVFVNDGNKACSINTVYLEEEDMEDAANRLRLLISLPLNESSFTLKPKDVVTLQLKSGTERFITDFETVKKDKIGFRMVFDVIDSKGDFHKIKVPIFEEVLKRNKGELEPDFKSLLNFPHMVKLLPSPVEKLVYEFPRMPQQLK